VEALKSRPEIDDIVVVDDGSQDETANAARSAGATEVITQSNAGKGAALSTAFRAARERAEIFLLLDGDLGASAAEAVKLIVPIERGEADMVVGLLPPDPDFAATGQSGGSGFVVRLANRGIERATGKTFQQPLCGQRAVRREVLDVLSSAKDGNIFARGFGVEVGLTIGALRAGFRVVEVETHFRHKVTGADFSGILHRARQYRDVARTVRDCLKQAR
jgi:glycosyltransferase involved in cell wall biosynthesis